MTVVVRGREEFRRYMAELPEKLERNILRGAVRAGARVIAEEAKLRCRDPEVAQTIGISSGAEPGLVTAKVRLRGRGAFKGTFLEFGTAAHEIAAGKRARQGAAGRMSFYQGTLKIDGRFAGRSVMHPGAKPYPFLRPALDAKLGEAVRAIGDYTEMRLAKYGLDAPDQVMFQVDEE